MVNHKISKRIIDPESKSNERHEALKKTKDRIPLLLSRNDAEKVNINNSL